MIFVGIDVAKDKHDCFILNSEGTVLADVFTIANNRIGFETLLSRIQSCSQAEKLRCAVSEYSISGARKAGFKPAHRCCIRTAEQLSGCKLYRKRQY